MVLFSPLHDEQTRWLPAGLQWLLGKTFDYWSGVSGLASTLTMTRLGNPDPLLTQLRHIAYAANVHVSISDSAADLWKKLVKHAPRALDKVLTDGTLTKPALRGQPGVSVDPRLTLAHLSHSVDQTQRPYTALPTVPTVPASAPVIASPRARSYASGPATHRAPNQPAGVQVAESVVHVADTFIYPEPPDQRPATTGRGALGKRSVVQLPPTPRAGGEGAPSAAGFLRQDEETEAEETAVSQMPTEPTAILGHMIASCTRLDLEMRQIPPLMDEAGAKGVESARLECLRTHVVGTRVAREHFLHEQRKLEKKYRTLSNELEGLKIMYKQRTKETQRLRFLLAKEELEDIQEDVVMGLLVNQNKGSDRRLNAMQR